MSSQHQVRFSRFLFVMQAIPKAMTKEKFSDQYFRLCVLAFYTAHIVASDLLCMNIRHTIKVAK